MLKPTFTGTMSKQRILILAAFGLVFILMGLFVLFDFGMRASNLFFGLLVVSLSLADLVRDDRIFLRITFRVISIFSVIAIYIVPIVSWWIEGRFWAIVIFVVLTILGLIGIYALIKRRRAVAQNPQS